MFGKYNSLFGVLKDTLSSKGSNFETIEVQGEDGKTYKTTPYHLRQAALMQQLSPTSILGKITGAALISYFVSKLFGKKSDDIPQSVIRSAWKAEKKD